MAILPKNKIKICTWNCRGINNKYHELIHFLQNYDIDVLLATETKLAPHLHYRIPGYSIYIWLIIPLMKDKGALLSL